MTAARAARDPVDTLFRDIVLVLGGVFALRGTDDETICQVARGLERVYRRARQRGAGPASPPASGPTAPHPAIQGLLHLTDGEETSS